VGITNYADRILFMDDGKIVEEGTQEQLLNRRGKFYELYDSQRKWY
jgi:ATP-binding cassette subfamily B protein